MSDKPTFDRVRPRAVDPEGYPVAGGGETRIPDREGKRALFSSEAAPPTLGAVAMVCSRCETRSVVSWTRALRLAFPSVPALVPGNGVRIWMLCRTCNRRSWVDISLSN